jgi:hypothetical protein
MLQQLHCNVGFTSNMANRLVGLKSPTSVFGAVNILQSLTKVKKIMNGIKKVRFIHI